MTILGIDPGIGRMGYGIIEHLKTQNAKPKVLDYGCIETQANTPVAERLLQIHEELTELMKEYEPDEMAVEELFFNTNTTTAMAVGRASGVALLVSSQCNVPCAEYTPSQIKVAATGYGRASKQQMQDMVTKLLGLSEIPTPDDAADALAVALCHGVSKTV